MKFTTSSAQCAGAQESCARAADRPFQPVPRWPLFAAIQRCSASLGLNRGDLEAMRTLLSFLPLKDKAGAEVAATSDMLLICYASNASICSRANGMDESSLRRHIRRLSAAGLVRRHDSATGKRFPLKRNGVVRDAYGIDLRPAFESAARLRDIAQEIEEAEEARRMMRSETLALRRRLLDAPGIVDDAIKTSLTDLTNVLRRKSTTIQQIRAIRDRLIELLNASPSRLDEASEAQAPALPAGNTEEPATDNVAVVRSEQEAACTPYLPAGDAQFARQVESPNLNRKKRQASPKPDAEHLSYEGLLRKYPNVAAFLPSAYRGSDCLMDSIRGLGISIGLRAVPYHEIVRHTGLPRLLAIFERMIQRIECIRHPQSYFEKAVVADISWAS